MWLKLDLDGINFHLQINNYHLSKKETWDEEWCRVSCSFIDEKNGIINCHISNNELLLCCEIEKLIISIEKLLDDGCVHKEEILFIEPDFELVLYPKQEKGYISMEWKVYLWSNGLTANYFSTEFSKDELKCLLAYLKYVTGKYSNDTPIIKEMLNLGILYG